MDETSFKGVTGAPVIAERQLMREGSRDHATIRIHQPELGNTTADMPWRCGYIVEGLPGLPEMYGAEMTLVGGEVWFADGQDSLNALVVALANIRTLIDMVEEEYHCVYVWPLRERGGHMLPAMVTQAYGREHERSLLEAMDRESERILRKRKP